MNEERDIHEIELDIQEARVLIKCKEALDRLMQNADFKEVIREGYFKEEAVRLVELKAAPQMRDLQDSIINSINGIGSLQQYFNTIWSLAGNALEAIRAGNQALDEIAEEDGES